MAAPTWYRELAREGVPVDVGPVPVARTPRLWMSSRADARPTAKEFEAVFPSISRAVAAFVKKAFPRLPRRELPPVFARGDFFSDRTIEVVADPGAFEGDTERAIALVEALLLVLRKSACARCRVALVFGEWPNALLLYPEIPDAVFGKARIPRTKLAPALRRLLTAPTLTFEPDAALAAEAEDDEETRAMKEAAALAPHLAAAWTEAKKTEFVALVGWADTTLTEDGEKGVGVWVIHPPKTQAWIEDYDVTPACALGCVLGLGPTLERLPLEKTSESSWQLALWVPDSARAKSVTFSHAKRSVRFPRPARRT